MEHQKIIQPHEPFTNDGLSNIVCFQGCDMPISKRHILKYVLKLIMLVLKM